MNLRTLKREKRLPLRQEPRATRPSHNLSQCHSWPLDGSLCFLTIISLLIFPFSSVGFDFHFLELKFLSIKKISSTREIGTFESFIITTLKREGEKYTQTHAHLKVTCAQRGWLLFAGMARGIFLLSCSKKKNGNRTKKKKSFFGMMVGRRQQLTNTPSHDNLLLAKWRKQRSLEIGKKKFVWKQNYKKLLLNWKEKKQHVWNQVDFFILILLLPPPLPSFIHQPLHHLIAPGDYKVSAVVMLVTNGFRSICDGRWMGPTHRTLASRSTSVGKWTEKPRWSHRSRRSICAPVGRWSWSSW